MTHDDDELLTSDIPLPEDLPLVVIALDDALGEALDNAAGGAMSGGGGAGGPGGDRQLSPGVRRALDHIAASLPRGIETDAAGEVPRVAETRTAYAPASSGLLGLAARQGLTVAEVAGRTALSPRLVLWLIHHKADMLTRCEPFVTQLTGALGVSRDTVIAALAQSNESDGSSLGDESDTMAGETVPDDVPLDEVIQRAVSLEAWQRAYWLELLRTP